MIVDHAVYEDGRRRPGETQLDTLYEQCKVGEAFTWLALYEPPRGELEAVAREFELHELAVEDAVKAHQRPKLERYGDSLFVVLKTARFVPSREEIEFGEVLVFVGADFLISVQHGEPALQDVRARMEARPDLLRRGPSAALYGIVDRVVDDYLPVVDALDDAIGAVEREVFSASRANPAARIYHLKREVLELTHAMQPLLDPLDSLARGDQPLVHEETRHYFRDIHDHLLRAVSRVTEFREVLTSVLTANLSQVAIRQNEDVRKISAWAAIIAVPTMVAGIYGMNFEHMPELEWTFGYPLVLAVIAAACVLLYVRFRRAGWL